MFRKTCLRQYGLDPAHYYTSPGLSWDALLKKTGVELELLTDYDQHLFIEKGMRGVSQWPRSATPKPTTLWSRVTTRRSLISHLIPRCEQSLRLGYETISPPAFGGWTTATNSQKPSQSSQLTGPRATYLRWTWSTQKTYTTRAMHIRWRPSAWWW